MLFIVYKQRQSGYVGPIGQIIADNADNAARLLGQSLEQPDAWHGRYGVTGKIVLHHLSDPNSQAYVAARTR